MSETGAGESAVAARAAEAWAWSRSMGALLLVVACWESFVRLDSTILAGTTKAWLLPLLLIGLTADGVVIGAVGGRAVVKVLDTSGARRLRRVMFPWLVAIATGLEYALAAYHHLDGRVETRVLAAIATGALLWSMAAATRTTRDSLCRGPGVPLPVAVAVAALASAAIAIALCRPDVFYALLKRNSGLGRVLGHGMAPFPPTFPAVAPPGPLPALAARHPIGKTSVVLLSIDALRADALGVYGAPPSHSPRLDALARHALVFTDAFTQSPNSAPSIATTLTGRYPFRHRVRNNRMPFLDPAPRLPEVLAAAGYATAAFVTNPNFSEPFQFARGFATYEYPRATLGADGLVRDTNDPEAVEAALAWVREQPGRPWFLWVHLMAPHSPYIPPDDLRPPRTGTRGAWFDVWNVQAAGARLEGGRTSFDRGVYAAAYAGEVASADRLSGRLLDGLDAAGALTDAHVIVFADHGESFGESDVYAHGRSLDRAETRVPLLWKLPQARRAATIGTTVQLADIMPTLLDILGIEGPRDHDGRDLAGLILGEVPEDDGFAFTESRYLHSMGVRGLLYGGRTRTRGLWLDAGYPYSYAFDRREDPGEQSRRRAVADPTDPLYARLVTLARDAQAELASPLPKVPLDGAQRARLRALGYAE